MNTETDKELIIRKSGPEELEDLVAFYRRIIGQLHKRNSVVKWSMEVYPTRQDIAFALKAGEMHAGTLGGRIVCAFRLGGNDETYDRFDWPTEVPPGEVSVIHLLAVDDEPCRPTIAGEASAPSSCGRPSTSQNETGLA